jgi:hypothetical protein
MAHQTSHRTRAGQAKIELAARCKAIDSDPKLSEEHKKAVKADLHARCVKVVGDARAAHASEIAATRHALQTRAFAFPDDPDSFRQALDTVSTRIQSPDQAATALSRARRVGDEVSQHAIFVVARERGFGEIVQRYVADHPATASALSDLAAFDAADEPEDVFGELRPPQLPAGLPRDAARLAELAARSGEPPMPR